MPYQYSPDLTTIFDEIPNILEDLLQNGKEPVELYFFEQGTDLSLWFARDGETIWVTFEKHGFCGKPYEHLPEDESQAILAVDFYSVWFLFLDELLESLVKENPHLAEAQSYLDYKYRLEQIRITQAPRPKAVPESKRDAPMKLSLFLDSTNYKGYMDGKLFDEEKHGLKFSNGYMIFSSAAVPGQMDNAVVYKGDYQPDAFEKGAAVIPGSNSAVTWGFIKCTSVLR